MLDMLVLLQMRCARSSAVCARRATLLTRRAKCTDGIECAHFVSVIPAEDSRVNPHCKVAQTGGKILRLEGFVRVREVSVRTEPISPQECRRFAAQCLRWATRAKSETHKSAMLSMAQHWMHSAQGLEQGAAPATSFGRARPQRRVRGHGVVKIAPP